MENQTLNRSSSLLQDSLFNGSWIVNHSAIYDSVFNDSAISNQSDVYDVWEFGEMEFILAVSFLGTVSLFGFLSNTFTLITLLRLRAIGQWLPMYTFLCHLAVSDIMVCIVCIPLTFLMNFTGPINAKTMNDYSCKVSRFFQFMGPGGSILLLTTVAYDRYKNIVCPLRAGRGGIMSRPTFLVASAWIYSIAVFIPTFYFAHVESLHTVSSWTFVYCITIPNNNLLGVLYLMFLSLMTFFVPLLLMFYYYFRVIRTVWFREKKLRSTMGTLRVETGMALRRSKRKTLKMLLTVLSFFLLCWTPFVIYTGFVERYVAGFPNPADTARFITYGFGLFNSVCNPVIYFFSSKPFRRQLKRLITCTEAPRKGTLTHYLASQTVMTQISSSNHTSETSLANYTNPKSKKLLTINFRRKHAKYSCHKQLKKSIHEFKSKDEMTSL